MTTKMLEANHDGRVFRIMEDLPEVGVYLLVYEGEVCTRDYLQSDVEACMKFALEEFGVTLTAWQQKTDA